MGNSTGGLWNVYNMLGGRGCLRKRKVENPCPIARVSHLRHAPSWIWTLQPLQPRLANPEAERGPVAAVSTSSSYVSTALDQSPATSGHVQWDPRAWFCGRPCLLVAWLPNLLACQGPVGWMGQLHGSDPANGHTFDTPALERREKR